MKKLLTIILAVLILGTALVGCGEEPADTQSTNSTQSTDGIQSGTQSNIQNDNDVQNNDEQNEGIDEEFAKEPLYKTPTDRTAFATSTNEFVANIEKIIDMNLYRRDEKDTDGAYYSLKSLDYDAKINYTVTLGNGARITLPTTFDKLTGSGLTTTASADETVKSNSFLVSYRTFKTNSNEKVLFCPVNLTESEDGNATELPLKDCNFFNVRFELNEYSHSDDKTSYYTQINNAPRFKACDIDAYSTIEETIKAIGNPYTIEYSQKDNLIRLYFSKKENRNSELIIEFVASGNYISSFELEYDYTNIKK